MEHTTDNLQSRNEDSRLAKTRQAVSSVVPENFEIPVIAVSPLFRADFTKHGYNSVYSGDVTFGSACLNVCRDNLAGLVCFGQLDCRYF